MSEQVTSTHCSRGHLRTAKSTRWIQTPNGRKYPICRKCESIRRNARYAADPAYREWSRDKAKAWYDANRSLAARQQENV